MLIAGALTALPFTLAMAQTTPTPAQEPPQQGTTFESLDANGDGKISKEEAATNESVSAQFSRYDQNGDGFIERAEVNAANSPPSSGEPQQ
jgi:Ca2+-binding EF-hand superfamily protein